uniref:Uncharacterized protein n=1 Tax=Rhizophora mucronata TaxID=61149 RepID=A0A2P2NG24_RHIMU
MPFLLKGVTWFYYHRNYSCAIVYVWLFLVSGWLWFNQVYFYLQGDNTEIFLWSYYWGFY